MNSYKDLIPSYLIKIFNSSFKAGDDVVNVTIDNIHIEEPLISSFITEHVYKIKARVSVGGSPHDIVLRLPKYDKNTFRYLVDKVLVTRSSINVLKKETPIKIFYNNGKLNYTDPLTGKKVKSTEVVAIDVGFKSTRFYFKYDIKNNMFIHKDELRNEHKYDYNQFLPIMNSKIGKLEKLIMRRVFKIRPDAESFIKYLVNSSHEQIRPLLKEAPEFILIEDPDLSLMDFLISPDSIKRIRTQLNRNYRKSNSFSVSSFDDMVLNYLNFRSQDGKLQNTLDTSILSKICQSNRVKILDDENNKLNFTKFMIGLICPVSTPEGNTVTVVNEILPNVVLKEGNVKLKLWDLHNKEMTDIDYYDYLETKVITYDSMNLLNRTLKKGKITYLEYGELIETDDIDLINSIQYAQTTVTDIFSPSISTVPGFNSVDGVRQLMSVKMLTQAVPIIARQSPIFTTDINYKIIEFDENIRWSLYDGEVVEVTNNKIKVKNNNGDESIYGFNPFIKTLSNTGLFYHSIVKVGDKIKAGDRLNTSNQYTDSGALALGVNLNVAYTSYMGYTYEDGVVISETASILMGHKMNKTIDFEINRDVYDDLEIIECAKIGDKIDGTDYIFNYQYSNPNNDIILEMLKVLKTNVDKKLTLRPVYIRSVNKTYKNVIVKDIKVLISKNLQNDTFIQSITKHLNINPSEIGIIDDKKSVIKINYNLDYTVPMQMGDKIANRYGSKWIVSHILPDEMRPISQVNNKPIDVIVTPEAVVARKNVGQIVELGFAKLLDIIESSVKGKSYSNEVLIQALGLIYPNLDSNDLINLLLGIKKGEKLNIISNIKNEYYNLGLLQEISDLLNIKDILKEKLLMKNPDKIDEWDDDEFVTENPVIVGKGYFMRLHFFIDDKLMATPTSMKGFSNPTDVVLKKGGQKIDEMTTVALLSHGANDIVRSLFKKDYNPIELQFNAVGLSFDLSGDKSPSSKKPSEQVDESSVNNKTDESGGNDEVSN